jgi:hypothetical protein
MARELDSTYAAGLAAGTILPVRLVQIAFKSQTVYCWSGPGPLSWNGHTFLGIGSLGKISAVSEGVDVQASGVTLTLSGIDPVLLGESMTDIQLGATARIWRGLWQHPANTLLGTPYQLFRGQVDKPTVHVSGEELTISLALESRIVNLRRASCRRYTSADQRLEYPTDSGFSWVEELNDLALVWG